MSKYDPLRRYLAGQPATTWSVQLSFRKVEGILGSPLPDSARNHRAWWANDPTHSYSVWLEAGWETREVDMASERVTFVRAGCPQPGRHPPPAQASPPTTGAGDRHQRRAAQQDRGTQTPALTPGFSGLAFARVCPIEADCDQDGEPRQYLPQGGYTNVRGLPLHRYGAGPFCRFRIPANLRVRGVYLVLVDGRVCYVGECQNLSARFNMGYGQISPRNCYKGGQPTNCKVNHLILEAAKGRRRVELWFRETRERKAVQAKLIADLAPLWNTQGKL